MSSVGKILVCLVAVILAGLTSRVHSAEVAGPNLENLLQNSPFGGLPGPKTAMKVETPLEFRGVLVEDGQQYFSLYEAASRYSRWVGLNEAGNPYTVQSYDDAKGTVKVEYQGHTLNLTLKRAVLLVSDPAIADPAAAADRRPVAVASNGYHIGHVAEEVRRQAAASLAASSAKK